jgi:hypothetical protein
MIVGVYRNGTVRYNTVKYGTGRYKDVWIINDSVITNLISYFGSSKNCYKIKVLSLMLRIDELGNIR